MLTTDLRWEVLEGEGCCESWSDGCKIWSENIRLIMVIISSVVDSKARFTIATKMKLLSAVAPDRICSANEPSSDSYYFFSTSPHLALLLTWTIPVRVMSPVSIALWLVSFHRKPSLFSSCYRSIELKPRKEPLSFIPQSDLRITNIALTDELADLTGRTSVKLSFQTPVKIDDGDEDEDPSEPISTTVLGSLTPGKVLSTCIHVYLQFIDI